MEEENGVEKDCWKKVGCGERWMHPDGLFGFLVIQSLAIAIGQKWKRFVSRRSAHL